MYIFLIIVTALLIAAGGFADGWHMCDKVWRKKLCKLIEKYEAAGSDDDDRG